MMGIAPIVHSDANVKLVSKIALVKPISSGLKNIGKRMSMFIAPIPNPNKIYKLDFDP